MLAAEEKKIVADWMGWKSRELGGGVFYFRTLSEGFDIDIDFDLNDAALVVAEICRRGEYRKFFMVAYKTFNSDFFMHEMDINFYAWLMAMESGEAVNFFRSMAKWIEENV